MEHMILHYDPSTGNVYKAEYDAGGYKSFLLPGLHVYEIEELPANHPLCLELAFLVNKTDAAGQTRWYVENGELYERDNWEAVENV